MPYQFSVQGIPVTCDTLSELLEAVKSGIADARPGGEVHAVPAATARAESRSRDQKKPGPQGKGPKRAWAEAEEYARTHKCTVGEARSIIARKKREAKEQALKKLSL